jgi:outer membrane protein OmpA-like peptidoglycan-associated protein
MNKLLPFLSFIFFAFSAAQAQEKAQIMAVVTNFKDVPQEGEQILFINQKTGETLKGISDENGRFNIKLAGPAIYEIKIQTIGDDQDYSTIEIPELGPGEGYSKMKLTIKFELPKTFTLDNVLFDTGKSTLKSLSFTELNEVVEVMKLKKKMNIEVAGHTDDVGSDASNMTLSQARADAVRNYLISKGIEANRVIAVGYGETQPVADNTTEEGRKQNRRTEVRITSN